MSNLIINRKINGLTLRRFNRQMKLMHDNLTENQKVKLQDEINRLSIQIEQEINKEIKDIYGY